MGQYYPPQNPYYPPQNAPEGEYDQYEYEDDYYDDDNNLSGDSMPQRLLIFISGGCLVFICMGCCLLTLTGLWVLDPGSSLVSTPIPGNDLGLSFETPAYPDESIVNDELMRLTLFEVNRNVEIPNVAPIPEQETLVLTIELVNLGEEEVSFNETEFRLINSQEQAYAISTSSGLVDGALGRGRLEPGQGIEGRLVYDLALGETNLILEWEGGHEVQPRYMYVQ